jgi:hypothetical protein
MLLRPEEAGCIIDSGGGVNDIEYELWLKDQSKSSTAEMQAAVLCSPAPAGSVPCPHQDSETWCCRFGPEKPSGMCPRHTFVHRSINWYVNGIGRDNHRSSIRCMISPNKEVDRDE